ncbi:MAG: hypothetical protein GPJ52_12870 [Candidatus Heimdallarchaeota archaeon]|nr:hypothetical protein [Candidatus Heimdallarchaeota archaeon]
MLSKNKKTGILISIIIISLCFTSKEIPNAESIDPFFTLRAGYLTIQQLECLNLAKQQLARIGINLEFVFFNLTDYLGKICSGPEYDLLIQKFYIPSESDPFMLHIFNENGTLNLAGYHTSMDYDEELGEGRNEWYIQTGIEMTPNDSQERINHCWEWQHYMMVEILPVLPLFTEKGNHSTIEFLFFNMREVRSYTGSRDAAPGFPSKTKGLLVRKAISYAINLEEIRRIVLGDDYEIFYHPTNPNMDEWLSPNSFRYCYNLDYARALMRAAGYDYGWCGQSSEPLEYLDWDELCNGNPTSVNVIGYDLIITLGVLFAFPLSINIYRKQKKKNLE